MLIETHSNIMPMRYYYYFLFKSGSRLMRRQPIACNRRNQGCDRIYRRCNSSHSRTLILGFCERERGRGCCFVRLHNMASDAYKHHMASLVHARTQYAILHGHSVFPVSGPSLPLPPPFQVPHLPRQYRIRTAAAAYFKKLVFY